MSDSETESDFQIIETQINLMGNMLDNHIKNNKQVEDQMSLKEALNKVIEMAQLNKKSYEDDVAISKAEDFISQL